MDWFEASSDQPRCAGANSVARNRRNRRVFDPRVGGEAEVVVRGHHDQAAAAGDGARTMLAGYDTQVSAETVALRSSWRITELATGDTHRTPLPAVIHQTPSH